MWFNDDICIHFFLLYVYAYSSVCVNKYVNESLLRKKNHGLYTVMLFCQAILTYLTTMDVVN